jgi:hypothetical protein
VFDQSELQTERPAAAIIIADEWLDCLNRRRLQNTRWQFVKFGKLPPA